MTKIQQEAGKEVILRMDHNNDLLKYHLHPGTQGFRNNMLERDLMLTVTIPTQITQTTASLIDNVFTTANLHKSFDSLILLDDMSDHLPSPVLLKQTKIVDKRLITFESWRLNDSKIKEIRNNLLQVDWNGELNSDSFNDNFNRFHDIVQKSMDNVAPIKTIQVSGKRRFCEPWMTKGIKTSSRKKKKTIQRKPQRRSHRRNSHKM